MFDRKYQFLCPVQKRQISDRQNRWIVHYSKRQICLFYIGRKNWYFLSKFYTSVEYFNMFMSNFFQNFSKHFRILKRSETKPGAYEPGSQNAILKRDALHHNVKILHIQLFNTNAEQSGPTSPFWKNPMQSTFFQKWGWHLALYPLMHATIYYWLFNNFR